MEDGLTLTVMVGAVPLKIVPSDKVPVITPLPVTTKVKLVDEPLQIVAVPLNAPVGLALTVTTVADDEVLWHPLALVTCTL